MLKIKSVPHASNYQFCFEENSLIAFLYRDIHLDRTNSYSLRRLLSDRTALRRIFGANLKNTKWTKEHTDEWRSCVCIYCFKKKSKRKPNILLRLKVLELNSSQIV